MGAFQYEYWSSGDSNYLNDYKFIADYISDNTDLFDKDEWAQKTMNSIYNNVIPFLENEKE